MSEINVGALQLKSLGSTDLNLKQTLEWLNKSDAKDLDLIVLQELCLWDYFCIEEDPARYDEAISNDCKMIQTIQNTANTLKKVIVFPYFEKRDTGLYHNSALVFDRDGSLAGHYRKMHIPDDPGFYEKYYFRPGDIGFKTISTSIGKLGVLICWDQWFPEAARLMTLDGANILIYPTAIGWDDNEPDSVNESQLNAWQTMMRSHSIANGIHTIAANRIGKEKQLKFWGNSFVSDPYGNLLQKSDHEFEGFVKTKIDLSQSEQARRTWPFFRDRRTDAYDGLLKTWLK